MELVYCAVISLGGYEEKGEQYLGWELAFTVEGMKAAVVLGMLKYLHVATSHYLVLLYAWWTQGL